MCTIPADPPGENVPELEWNLFSALSRLYGEDALILTDQEGAVVSWSEGARRIFGYSAEEMIGTAFYRVVPEELHSHERGILRELAPGKPRRYEGARLKKDGGRLQVSSAVSAIVDSDGLRIRVLRCEREAVAAKEEEHALSRLAAIVESSNDAIVSKNLDGIVTSWNQAAFHLFGYRPEEMIGEPILKIIPPNLHSEEAEILRKIRTGERIEHYETKRVRKDGELVDVSLTISPVRDRHGKIVGSSKIARNLSEQRKMERHLLETEQFAAAGRMVANVAHQINNPLETVMNLVYLARVNLPASNRARPYLIHAESELERISRLTRQALGHFRDRDDTAEIHVGALLEEVLRVHQSKLLATGIAVDCTFSDQRPLVASGEELMQVFSNLVTNAIEAMPSGGVLTIETRELGDDGVEVLLIDRGVGISRENLGRIFEPFFTTKGSRGSGLGLWVARQLLESHRGRISVESTAAGLETGTRVAVYLPFQGKIAAAHIA
jgi:PAS domain S-box-containing protein